MATIKNIDQQKKALSQITKLINDLKSTNQFLLETNETGVYTISFNKLKTPLKCTDKHVINDLVLNYKKEIVNEILTLASDNNIELDDEEQQIIFMEQ